MSVSGQVATITFDGSDDAITPNLGPRGPATLAFADGTTMSVEGERQLITQAELRRVEVTA